MAAMCHLEAARSGQTEALFAVSGQGLTVGRPHRQSQNPPDCNPHMPTPQGLVWVCRAKKAGLSGPLASRTLEAEVPEFLCVQLQQTPPLRSDTLPASSCSRLEWLSF